MTVRSSVGAGARCLPWSSTTASQAGRQTTCSSLAVPLADAGMPRGHARMRPCTASGRPTTSPPAANSEHDGLFLDACKVPSRSPKASIMGRGPRRGGLEGGSGSVGNLDGRRRCARPRVPRALHIPCGPPSPSCQPSGTGQRRETGGGLRPRPGGVLPHATAHDPRYGRPNRTLPERPPFLRCSGPSLLRAPERLRFIDVPGEEHRSARTGSRRPSPGSGGFFRGFSFRLRRSCGLSGR